MDVKQILAMVGRMFPSANLNGAFQQAQQAIQGTPDTLQGVSEVAKRMGIDRNAINVVFQKYGNTAQARTICSMLGTTPEALKNDAEKIVSGNSSAQNNPVQSASKRFPRLK